MNILKYIMLFMIVPFISFSFCLAQPLEDTMSCQLANDILRIEASINCSLKGSRKLIVSITSGDKYELKAVVDYNQEHSRSVLLSKEEWDSLIRLIKNKALLFWKPYKYDAPRVYDGCGSYYIIVAKTWEFHISTGETESPLGSGFDALGRSMRELAERHNLQMNERPIFYPTDWNHRYDSEGLDKSNFADTSDVCSISISSGPQDKSISESIFATKSDGHCTIQAYVKRQEKYADYPEQPLDQKDWNSLLAIVAQEKLVEWQPGSVDSLTNTSDSKIWMYAIQSSGGWTKSFSVSAPYTNMKNIIKLKNCFLHLIQKKELTDFKYLR